MLGLRRFFVQRIDWKPEIFLGPSFQRTGSKMCGGSWGLNQSYIEKQFICSRKKSMKRYFLYLIYRSIVNQSWCSYLNQFSRPFSLAIFHVFATPPISIVPFQREQKKPIIHHLLIFWRKQLLSLISWKEVVKTSSNIFTNN